MSGAIRRHLRSNAIGYVALFIALTTGSAYALDGHNTVYSDDIVNGQVSSNDLHDTRLAPLTSAMTRSPAAGSQRWISRPTRSGPRRLPVAQSGAPR
jgi:hypothetical protein